MKAVIALVENLKLDPISETINSRMQEFEELGKKSEEEIFKELCFCLLTANFSASGGIKIQSEIEDGFSVLPKEELAKKLRELGHRFPNVRAEYIHLARASFPEINLASERIREDIVFGIKGLGMKESSHFLRNIGFSDYAIIDFHIVDFLVSNGLLEKPKTKQITPKRYLEIESVLRKIAEATNLSLGELDLYLWFKETGKVLK